MEEEKKKHGKVAEESKLRKAIRVFLEEDEDAIKQSIVKDVLKPRAETFGVDLSRRAREFIISSFTDALRSILYPNSRKVGGYSGSEYSSVDRMSGSRTRYVEYYNGTSENQGTYVSTSNRIVQKDVRHLKKVLLPDYGAAAKVKDDLKELIRTRKKATVADYYQLCNAYMDDKHKFKIDNTPEFGYGWKEGSFDVDDVVDGAVSIIEEVEKDGTYYWLDLPRPMPLA